MINETTGANNNVQQAQNTGLALGNADVATVRINGSIVTVGLPNQPRQISSSDASNSANNATNTTILPGTSDAVFANNVLAPFSFGVGDIQLFEISELYFGQQVRLTAFSQETALRVAIHDSFGQGLAVGGNVSPQFPANPALIEVGNTNFNQNFFFAVAGAQTTTTNNIFDPSTNFLTDLNPIFSQAGPIQTLIEVLSPDYDFYTVDASAGQVIGFQTNLPGAIIQVFDPNGQLLFGQAATDEFGEPVGNLSNVYSPVSPLPGDANSTVASGFIATQSGTYTVGIMSPQDNNYTLDLTVAERAIIDQPVGTTQVFFLDFNGAPGSLLSGLPNAGPQNFSPLSDFLPGFGISANQENALINAIIARFTQLIRDNIAAVSENGNFAVSGTPGEFAVTILNSRDHPDQTNNPNVSSIVIGGTRNQAGVPTNAQDPVRWLSETIDIGNFDLGDDAIVPLDAFAAPAGTDVDSIQSLSRASNVTQIQIVAEVIAQSAAAAAGQLLGNLTTSNQLGGSPIATQDQRGLPLQAQIGSGPDDVFGTADDTPIGFLPDRLALLQGGLGGFNTTGSMSFALGTGTGGVTGPSTTPTNGNDLLTGTAQADAISALDGADTINGLGGNDTLNGNVGNDIVNGGNGDDTLRGQNGSDELNGGTGSDLLEGGAGTDTLNGDNGNDTLNGGTGNDTLSGDGGNDVLNGNAGNDTINGGDGNDQLFGGADFDTLDGQGGDDFLNGGSSNDILRGDAGNDGLVGGDGNDNLDGGAGRDTLSGELGDDLLSGGAGNDTLNGGGGNDRLFGGSDFDTLRGQGGNDVLNGGASNDILTGDEGDDELLGEAGNDNLNGGTGNDQLFGGSGNDTLNGSTGSDFLNGGAQNDSLFGGSGNDTLIGGDGNDDLEGGGGIDVLSGNEGDDVLAGGADNDTLNGGGGVDRLFGGSGNDLSRGQAGNDFISSGAGDDRLEGGNDNDSLFGGSGQDTLIGEAGNDFLQAGSGSDFLFGGSGNDTLDGRESIDVLNGGAGDDTLIGGTGADTFIFAPGFGNDTVTDFQDNIDELDLTAFNLASINGALSFANEVGGDVVFTFGPNTFTIENTTEAQLANDILI
ncbi:MAG: calcium-binding protein [Pseudomonadota bacterium]